MDVETRKVQKVGYSTLVVSIPKQWVDEVGLKRGDTVTFEKEENGTLRLYPRVKREERRKIKATINSDLIEEPNLLLRILTGSYILGRDTMRIVSKDALRPQHLAEIRDCVSRLTGINVVEQTLKHMEILNFIDPTNFPVYSLMRRLHIISSSMLEAGIKALQDGKAELAAEVANMENEADRIYWLIVRQLLLAVADRGVSKKMGIQSPLHIVGNRTVAKSLEEMADYAESLAADVGTLIKMADGGPDDKTVADLTDLTDKVLKIKDMAMDSLFDNNINLANQAIEEAKEVERRDEEAGRRILERGSQVATAVTLRSMYWSLRQIARYCDTVAEIAINRVLEASSEVVQLESME